MDASSFPAKTRRNFNDMSQVCVVGQGFSSFSTTLRAIMSRTPGQDSFSDFSGVSERRISLTLAAQNVNDGAPLATMIVFMLLLGFHECIVMQFAPIVDEKAHDVKAHNILLESRSSLPQWPHISRHCDTIAAAPRIARYFLREVSAPPKMVRYPPLGT